MLPPYLGKRTKLGTLSYTISLESMRLNMQIPHLLDKGEYAPSFLAFKNLRLQGWETLHVFNLHDGRYMKIMKGF